MSAQRLLGVLTLATLLRIMGVVGIGVGVISAAVAVSIYWRGLGLGQILGLFLGGAIFNALALMFATLVGYWPYRALARRRRFGLHRLGVHLMRLE